MFKLTFVLLLTCIVLSGIKCDYSKSALELWEKIKAGTVPDDDLKKYGEQFKGSLGDMYEMCTTGMDKKLAKFGEDTMKKIKENVSPEGLVIISKYSQSYFRDMNTLTREIDKKSETKWNKKNKETMKWLKKIAMLSDTLVKLAEIVPYNGFVYRYEKAYDGWKEKYKKGSTFVTNYFASTSTDEAAKPGIVGKDLKLKMKVKGGIVISKFSEYEDENEVLIDIGSQFLVTGFKGASPVDITLEEQ